MNSTLSGELNKLAQLKTDIFLHLLFIFGFLNCLPLLGEEGKSQLTKEVFNLPGNFNELGLDEGLSAQTLLKKHGVVFKNGSSARFLKASGQLEVTNNTEEIMISEAVVTIWNRIGYVNTEDEFTKQRRQVEKKLTEIYIPLVVFENTPLTEALKWLEKASVEYDLSTNNDAEKGISISMDLTEEIEIKPTTEANPFGFGLNETQSSQEILDTPITLRLKDLSLAEALRNTVSLAQLQYSVTASGVLVPRHHQMELPIETMVYSIPPEFNEHLKLLIDSQESSECFLEDPFQGKNDKKISRNLTTRELLESSGISFPVGASIQIFEAKNLFLVKNNSDQIYLIEALLGYADAKASPEWQSQREAIIKSKLASIRLPDLFFEKTPFYQVKEKLKHEILRLDIDSKIWNRGISIDLNTDTKDWSDQWNGEISIDLKSSTAIEALEKLAAELDWKFTIQPRGVTFLAD